MTFLPLEHFEGLQVQKYEALENSSNSHPQYYRPHLDSIGGTSRRVATFVYFLTDVEEGGETFFPLVPVDGMNNIARDMVLDANTALGKGRERWEQLCAAPYGDNTFLKVMIDQLGIVDFD